ncbi:MAG: ubiquinone/menaquinone biosynthesis methyltransferase [Bacteroidales bacterium]|jgi:demethylmenaquinone methyltransferase/2-methoxy-6-polyprenyl-1,4-benzoquinol methylase|nr:ubiquinone/menaquinone biosynthesis methyltransferase [Bacteroidales bacterium]
MNREAAARRPLFRMFNEVPGRYDIMNRILTLGQDERWRKKAVRICMEEKPGEVLDICTGTADIALRIARMSNSAIKVTASDFSQPMLDVAAIKAERQKGNKVNFVLADTADLPFDDDTYDVTTIGFAFRNLTYKNKFAPQYLSEIRRTLKPGGIFIIAESSQPKNAFLRFWFRIYLRVWVQGLGGLISGHRKAYKYLAVSARNYFSPEEVGRLLQENGFTDFRHYPVLGGSAAIYTVRKPAS